MDKTFEVLKKDLDDLKQTIDPFLYRHYVAEFLSSLHESEDALKILEEQKKALVLLDPEVKHLFGQLKKGAVPIIERLYSPELIGFRDLAKASDEILRGQKIPMVTDRCLSKISKEDFLKNLRDALAIQEKELNGLVKRGEERLRQKKEIELFSKKIQTIFSSLALYKDLKPSVEVLIEKNRSFLSPVLVPKEASLLELDEAYAKRWEEFRAFSSTIEQEHKRIDAEREKLEYRCQDALLTIRCRLFEIFFAVTSYPDLEDEFRSLQGFLSRHLEEAIAAFYDGKIDIDTLCEACQELAYEHDVVRMRNEISHRALRLKDVRDELLRLIRAVHEEIRFLLLSGGNKEEFFFALTEESKALEKLLEDVENPFFSFQKADSKDACNGVFRAFWIRIEGLQPKVEKLLEQAKSFIEKNFSAIQKQFLKVLDDLEEVLSTYEISRPSLVAKAEQQFLALSEGDLCKELFSEIQQIEAKYPFCQPLSFFMTEQDFQLRREMLAKAKKLDAQLKELCGFSKTMQYIKTFEEERIDAILEGLEHLHMYGLGVNKEPKELFTESLHRMVFACLAMEEEVFADIGLLDSHALMDVDPNHLKQILKIAYIRAKNRLSRYIHEIERIPNVSPLFERTKKAIHDDLEIMGKEEADKDYLAALRLFCHSVFSLRILKAALRQDVQAMELLVLQDLHLLYRQIGRRVSWSKPLSHIVMKTHAVTIKGISDLEAFIKKIFSDLDQIPQAKGMLEGRQSEEEEFLRTFARIAGRSQVPFEYLPGCMIFFLRPRSLVHE
jgi:hypothetical protein